MSPRVPRPGEQQPVPDSATAFVQQVLRIGGWKGEGAPATSLPEVGARALSRGPFVGPSGRLRALDRCIDRVTASLHAKRPDMGRDVAIDGSDMPAYANGQRFVSKNGPMRERFSAPRRDVGPPLRRLDAQGAPT